MAVIGPNADNMYNQLGDYTAPQDPDRIVTLFEGIRDKGMAEEVRYAQGCAVRDEGVEDIDAAVRIARWADAVVLVVGGSSARDFQTSYEATGAAIVDKHLSDMDCGEGYDRSTLKLLGNQEELMRRIYDLGKPVVTVYIQGRPLDMNLAAERSDALLTMWYPGMEGGNALADILWNDYNPSGRLPISIPRSVGQLPVCYSQPAAGDYVEESSQPLYPFGYGLSYTQFAYSDLQVETLSGQDTLCRVGCLVTNTGPCRGEEVAQLYVRDEVASVAPASKRLKGFKKVFLESGESQRVVFSLTARDLSVYDGMQGWHVEPGAFSLMVGGSSADIRLEQQMALPDGTVRPD